MQKSECANIKPTLPKFCGKIHSYTLFLGGKLCKLRGAAGFGRES